MSLRPRHAAAAVLLAQMGCGSATATPADADPGFTMKLRVHILKSSVHDLDAAAIVDDVDITSRMQHINNIFEPTSIRWELEGIQRDQAADVGPFKRVAAGKSTKASLPPLVDPADLIWPEGLDLYVARDFSAAGLGGAYRCTLTKDQKGPGVAFIAARAKNDSVQALRKWAHELGHALGLAHTPCTPEWADNLMMSGKCEHAKPRRIRLRAEQVVKAQKQAATGLPAKCKSPHRQKKRR